MYFYSLVKHHCIFLYNLVKIQAQRDSAVVITAGTPVCQAFCGSLSDGELVSKTGRASSRERQEGMGTGEAGPARREETRQQESGAKRNEAEMKSREPEGEMGFGANSSERPNVASANCAKLSDV